MNKKPTRERLPKNNVISDKAPNSDESTTSDNQWIKDSLQNHLDAHSDNLDFTITSKLSAARHRAIAQEHTTISKSSSYTSGFNWTTALSSTAVLAIALFMGSKLYPTTRVKTAEFVVVAPTNQIPQQELIEDLNLLSASDDIEFYQSVDFLEWMEANSG